MQDEQPEYESRQLSWEQKTPWFRRISARTGLQGKLVLSFMFLLVVTLGAASMQFIGETRDITEDVIGAKATTIAGTVGVAAEQALIRNDRRELATIGRKVLNTGDIIGLAFFSPSGEMLSSSWRNGDPDGRHARAVPNPRQNPNEALRVRTEDEPGLGPHVEVTVPVRVTTYVDGKGPGLIVGFVTVALSESNNAWRIGQTQAIVVLIGAVSALVSLPLVYMLVHRIFHPIRALVDATNRIAAGDLGTEVAVHRPDVIGTLARAFNEMVKKVRQQQQELAATNDKLFKTNVQLEQANGQLATANFQLARANEKLADANRDLEAKVVQRTAQVETANKRLRSEIAEKEDFLRAVSHDLNAPLRNISGMATMLLMKNRERFDEDIIHRLERIQKNVEVETDLIAELLELSRIKTRRQRTEDVDLNTMVRELGELFGPDLEGRQIRLVIDSPLPTIHCERARLRQVFQNLVDNAIKYMGDGSPRGMHASAEPEQASCSLSTRHSALSTFTKEIHVGCAIRPDAAEFHV